MMESICTARDLKEITSHMKSINMFFQLSARDLFVKFLKKEETLGGLRALDPKQIKCCKNMFSKYNVGHRKKKEGEWWKNMPTGSYFGVSVQREGHCLDALFEAQGMCKPHTRHRYQCWNLALPESKLKGR